MTRTHGPLAAHPLRAPVLWGVVWGLIRAASPLGFWWLDPAVVYALSLALIATVYIGFAVADGRPTIVAQMACGFANQPQRAASPARAVAASPPAAARSRGQACGREVRCRITGRPHAPHVSSGMGGRARRASSRETPDRRVGHGQYLLGLVGGSAVQVVPDAGAPVTSRRSVSTSVSRRWATCEAAAS